MLSNFWARAPPPEVTTLLGPRDQNPGTATAWNTCEAPLNVYTYWPSSWSRGWGTRPCWARRSWACPGRCLPGCTQPSVPASGPASSTVTSAETRTQILHHTAAAATQAENSMYHLIEHPCSGNKLEESEFLASQTATMFSVLLCSIFSVFFPPLPSFLHFLFFCLSVCKKKAFFVVFFSSSEFWRKFATWQSQISQKNKSNKSSRTFI